METRRGGRGGKKNRNVDGEMRAHEVLAAAVADLQAAVQEGWTLAFFPLISRAPLYPKSDAKGIREMANLYRSQARAAGRSLAKEARGVQKRFLSQIDWVIDGSRDVRKAKKHFSRSFDWAIDQIDRSVDASLTTIAAGRYWGLQQLSVTLIFPDFPPILPLEVETVWESEQRHSFSGVPVDLKKLKINVKFLGTTINIGYLVFPKTGDVQPPPKVFTPSRPVTQDGITLTALDTIDIEKGNLIRPAAGNHPEVRFWGYGKMIYGSGVPDGCTLEFKQVVYPKFYLGYAFADGTYLWGDISQGKKSGSSFGEELDTADLGTGMKGVADFPNFTFPPQVPVCSYVVRDDLFRTWVILKCANETTVLGYWEWSFRQILHQGNNGTEDIEAAPANVPRPPNGWPRPGSGPTTWTKAGDAPKEAKDDFDTHF